MAPAAATTLFKSNSTTAPSVSRFFLGHDRVFDVNISLIRVKTPYENSSFQQVLRMRRPISCSFILCSYLVLFLLVVGCSLGADTLTSSQSMKDRETLVSADGSFVLGFFSRRNSTRSYLGIWFSIDPDTVVWVANRENPVNDSNRVLMFSGDGNIVVLGRSRNVIWSSYSSRNIRYPALRLLNSGNLVIGESGDLDSGNYSWQSFDNPSDTLLAGMKLGWDLRRGFERHLTSWKSVDDPTLGDYTYGFKLEGLMQGVLMMSSVIKFRTGPWNGLQFSGFNTFPTSTAKTLLVYNETDAYFELESLEGVISKWIMNPSGILLRHSRKQGSTSWDLMYTIPMDFCDSYGQCGVNGFCMLDKDPRCQCLPGFVPKSMEDWMMLNHTAGCVRQIPLNCSNEGFRRVSSVKLPDLINFWLNKNMSLEECKVMCWNKCSCTAYANSDVRNGGSGCLMWFGDLHDIKEFHGNQHDQEMYVRLSVLSLDHNSTQRSRLVIASVTSAIAGMLILGLVTWTIKRKCRSKRKGLKIWEDDIDLPLFNFSTIATATDNFSEGNLIGAGGFGSVYKGNLFTNKEVAVKRLSKNSGQGQEEFMNEAVLIAKLQHKNLVGLLGCCIEREERMLIYEYMPNKSLDYFIFYHDRSPSLPWEERYAIVSGIARGLLYLHHDSKLQVIHRDLKASNILLDGDMNPKISDFGLARIFSGNDKAVTTRRIIGTYGYMSPEYAFDGKFSVKSDVFSFGVLLLEIVCGEKNRGFSLPDHYHNLLGHAWLL